jgi:hypothetical protein
MFNMEDCLRRNALLRQKLALPIARHRDIKMCQNLKKMLLEFKRIGELAPNQNSKNIN